MNKLTSFRLITQNNNMHTNISEFKCSQYLCFWIYVHDVKVIDCNMYLIKTTCQSESNKRRQKDGIFFHQNDEQNSVTLR